MIPEDAVRTQLERQVSHWEAAIEALGRPDDFAAPEAWRAVERYLGQAVRSSLHHSTERLRGEVRGLRTQLQSAITAPQLVEVAQRLQRLRRSYLAVETVVDFFGDAVNSRTSPSLAVHLQALDRIASLSMAAALGPLGRPVPPVLTYIDKGLGASILRAGVRLWDGGASPVASIKITRHNLLRPTSLIHETGHQVAHILGWNTELAARIEHALRREPQVAELWASWVSEITADAFAFAHCGYGAVASLHDVVANEPAMVLRLIPGDPHPVAWIRVLLGVEMCVRVFGDGPWNDLGSAWRQTHPLDRAPGPVASALDRSLPFLGVLVDLLLSTRLAAFGGRSLSELIDPRRVSPTALERLAITSGGALFRSPHWAQTEALRILALSSLRMAVEPLRTAEHAAQFASFAQNIGKPAALADAA
ncbi:hypothetical protein ACVWW9_002081 [Agrococcus sp. UYP33]